MVATATTVTVIAVIAYAKEPQLTTQCKWQMQQLQVSLLTIC